METELEVVDQKTGELVAEMPQQQLLDVAALMPVARENKRDMRACIKAAIEIATMDKEAAEDCFYSVKRGDGYITGPSIGLAETMAACWGNIISGVDRIDIGEKEVTIYGGAIDLQSGMAWKGAVVRPICYSLTHKQQSKRGKRYNADMINMTVMAAQSFLFRNVNLRLIPRPVVNKVYRAALACATGEGKTWPVRQLDVLAYWENLGVRPGDVLRHLNVNSGSDIGMDDMEYLLGIAAEVRDNVRTVEEIFSTPRVHPDAAPPQEGTPKDMEEATEVLKAQREAATPPPEPPVEASGKTTTEAAPGTADHPLEPPTTPDGGKPAVKKAANRKPTKGSLMTSIEARLEVLGMPEKDLNTGLVDLLDSENKFEPGKPVDMNKLSADGLGKLKKWLDGLEPWAQPADQPDLPS